MPSHWSEPVKQPPPPPPPRPLTVRKTRCRDAGQAANHSWLRRLDFWRQRLTQPKGLTGRHKQLSGVASSCWLATFAIRWCKAGCVEMVAVALVVVVMAVIVVAGLFVCPLGRSRSHSGRPAPGLATGSQARRRLLFWLTASYISLLYKWHQANDVVAGQEMPASCIGRAFSAKLEDTYARVRAG